MAVVEWGELPERTGSIKSDFKHAYQRVFKVITDDVNDGPRTVAAAVGLGLGNTYQAGNDTDEGSFVNSIDVRETDRGQQATMWLVTVQYDGVDPTQAQGGEATENPLEKPVEWRYGTNRFERVIDRDIDGTAVRNTVGDPFDPPLVIDDSRPVIQATRNEATFNPASAYVYKDVVNSAVWFGGAAKTWKCNAITAKSEFHAELGIYWVVDYEFEYNPDTWTKKILNQGMRQKVGSKRLHVMSGDGTPVSLPVPLSEAGLELNFDETPHVLEFEVYPAVAFSVFNLE